MAKILLVVVMLAGVTFSALADRGVGKKSKAKVGLNITTTNSLKNSISINLKSGLKYKGSLLANQQVTGNAVTSNTLLTYQKGNTVYIIPYKQVIAVPEMKQGYTGMKIIIRTH
ncbi:MAG TPA: hypothetical protein VK498_03045 [Ferruginibacter sp.]|nr:hypothetical protein [Ferruginibacter sp.]